MKNINETIKQELQKLEQEENVQILYACESGSRAWGFPSQDSDYDVRFIYIRPVEWYLSIFNKRDVIERPINDMLDISGWDLQKTLRLFRKSNPPLMEWLQSPIGYVETSSVAERLRELRSVAFSPKASVYHYLHMANGNYRTYLQRDSVRVKKYFYVLRPILACDWIIRFGTLPPIEFEKLADEMMPEDGVLRGIVKEMLARKRAGEELDYEPRIALLNEFIEEKLTSLAETAASMPAAATNADEMLDPLFRSALNEVWGARS
ncbi:nucleotidyltransferase domain-containing protein [Paenibacillus sp. GCM10027627]|uniref:nucleotidyltransferase domain-containing protein n=1 Tax=unclassified Paenibacillus TaxID=185978 RepID=UPI00362A7414